MDLHMRCNAVPTSHVMLNCYGVMTLFCAGTAVWVACTGEELAHALHKDQHVSG